MAALFPSISAWQHHNGGRYREVDTLNRLADSLSDAYSLFHNIDWAASGVSADFHGEIDIIVMNQCGDLLLMEVKAGSVELRSNGIYKKYGGGERRVDQQIKSQYSNLKARLQHAGLAAHLKYCLILPDYQIGDQETAELPRDRIVDATGFDYLGSYVRGVLSPGLPDSQAQLIKKFLCNELDVVKDFSVLNEQVRVSNTRLSGGLATWVPRITVPSRTLVVSATAGSGKTLLATQLLENAVNAGQKALYVCFNRSLADSMLKVTPVQSQVATFHELSIQYHERSVGEIDFDSPEIFGQAVQSYIEYLSAVAPFLDVLIMDEAQDFELEWVEALSSALKDSGMLYLLQDQSQRLYDRPVFDCTDAVVVESNENFRSPRAVVETINIFGLTRQKILARSAYVGSPPDILLYQNNTQSLSERTAVAISHCLDKGFKPNEVIVVTLHGLKNSVLARPEIGGHTIRYFSGQFDKNRNPVWTNGDILFDSVYRFKGQSAPAVIVTEIHFDTLGEQERKKLFVAMTRAEIDLTLVMSEQAERLLTQGIGG